MNNEEIRSIFKNILMSNDKEDVKNSLLDWKESCSEKLFYSTKTGMAYVYMPNLFPGWKRDQVYETALAIIDELEDEKKYSVVIPQGNGLYRTLVRNANGGLEISDKRYKNIYLVKRHNSMVPGGITVSELQNSDLKWCMQFMEELDD